MDGMQITEGMMRGPDGAILRFYYDSAANNGASAKFGRPIFDTVLYVDVITPGQSSSTPSFELERLWSEQSKETLGIVDDFKRGPKYAEFKEQIDKFKAGSSANVLSGTPLKQWPRADRGLVATLAAINIHTVEQLAEVSDGNLQNIGMGARELREQAKAFLDAADASAPVSDMVDQIQHLTLEVQRLNQALALANNQNTQLQQELAQAKGVPPPVERKLVDITL